MLRPLSLSVSVCPSVCLSDCLSLSLSLTLALSNVCRAGNTDRIFVAFPTQFVMLQKLTELLLSIHMQLDFWVWVFLTLSVLEV